MNRVKVFYLRIAASFLFILSMVPISLAVTNIAVTNIAVTNIAVTNIAETNFENENNETDFASMYNENKLMDQEIGLNFRFLTSMLQMLDLNLNLINGTLNARVEEYPFLQPTIEGTEAGIATTDSILGVLESNPENLSETENSLVLLNENMERLNSSLGYPDGMIEAANSTLGEPDSTTPMIVEMFKSVKAMTELFE